MVPFILRNIPLKQAVIHKLALALMVIFYVSENSCAWASFVYECWVLFVSVHTVWILWVQELYEILSAVSIHSVLFLDMAGRLHFIPFGVSHCMLLVTHLNIILRYLKNISIGICVDWVSITIQHFCNEDSFLGASTDIILCGIS